MKACEPVQPAALVPVTVYVVVEEGEATTVAPVVLLRPVDGVHEYVVAPVAVSEELLPAQIAAVPPTPTVGLLLIVSVPGTLLLTHTNPGVEISQS